MVREINNMLFFSLSLILGGLLGTFLKLDYRLNMLGEVVKKKFSPEDPSNGFVSGFVVCSMLFCVGAMAIVGSFEAGALGKYDIILTKAVVDGAVAIMMASIYGIGVAFSAFTVLVYQGILTLSANWVEGYVTEVMLAEITGVGGAMLILVGLNILGITKVKTVDFIPAFIFVVAFVLLFV